MKTKRSHLIVIYSLAALTPHATGSPFVPLEWQQRVKAGPLEAQRKHTVWNRDLNQNFVDDALEALAPDQKTTVIVQLNQCLTRADVQQRLGQFGTVRRVGTLVSYAILENVRAGDAAEIAKDPAVAAVEQDEVLQAFNDTATRVVRARASTTFSPETFANAFPGSTGLGINVAIVDTGVDDAVHNAFAGKFVSGDNATTATVGNPDGDDGQSIAIGPNGVANTAAAGDDLQLIGLGGVSSGSVTILVGPNGILNSVAGGDDFIGILSDGTTQAIGVGPNGISNSTAAGDDIRSVPLGQGPTNVPIIAPGVNGTLNTVPSGDDIVRPGTWHGTHVAGIVMGLGVGPGCRPATDGSVPNDCAGMATGAGLVDVKVLNSAGSGSTSDIIAGLEWLWADGNARVVNMSLGGNTPSDGTSTISKVINALVENGITVVVAAGNSGLKSIGAVASSELAITVAAADDHGTVDRTDDTIAPFSTFGPRTDFTGVNPLVGQLKPDITAPGVGIMSAEGNSAASYHALSGTSMATPYVSGGAALLLSLNPNIPPGSLKELLKRSAFITPAQAIAGASFPGTDGIYNTKWGYGLMDVYQAGVDLMNGIANVTFTACTGPNCGGNCPITGGRPSWANDTDIQLATDPPIQGQPNTITIHVVNKTAATAENVVVCVGVKELGAGLNQFYAVGCKTITLGALASTTVNFPWTPTFNNHQCIQATINYGFDQEFCDNQTQRNTSPVPANSDATATFRVENPFNETATIVVTRQFAGGNDAIQVKGPRVMEFTMKPEDCPILVPVTFSPAPGVPIGSRATWRFEAQGFTPSKPNGVELSGVQFDVVMVAGGIDRAYSVGRHASEGLINLPLSLAGLPTSDPRRSVDELLVVFNVDVTTEHDHPFPQDVRITSARGSPIPEYTVAFEDGIAVGKELRIHFAFPLADEDRYRFDFGSFLDSDHGPLLGDTDFDLRVLQGDANGSGAVTATDVSFVRGQINQAAAFGQSSRADVNLSGSVSGPDVSFVRARIGHSAP